MFRRQFGWSRAAALGVAVSLAGLTAVTGCKSTPNGVVADNGGADPADVNQAPVDPNQPQQGYAPGPAQGYAQPKYVQPKTRVLGQSQSAYSQQSAESYQQAAPVERAPDPGNYTPPQGQYQDNSQYQGSPAYQAGDENFDQTIDQYAEQPPPPLPV